MSAISVPSVSQIVEGDVWVHKSSRRSYIIRGVSKFSSDCKLDGTWIVEYERDGHFYSSSINRFFQKFDLLVE